MIRKCVELLKLIKTRMFEQSPDLLKIVTNVLPSFT